MLCDLQAGTGVKRGREKSHRDTVVVSLHTLCDLQAGTGEKRGHVRNQTVILLLPVLTHAL